MDTSPCFVSTLIVKSLSAADFANLAFTSCVIFASSGAVQSALAFALGLAPPVVLLACPANTLVAKSRHRNRVVTLFIVFSFRVVLRARQAWGQRAAVAPAS